MSDSSRKYWTGNRLTEPKPHHENCILVAGSNVQGWSGAGTARLAVKHWGAKMHQSRGMSGRSYLLPTKSLKANWVEKQTGIHYALEGDRSLSPAQITANIAELYIVANANPDKFFIVPYIRTRKNLNGYSYDELLSMFVGAGEIPINIVFHESWRTALAKL